MHIAFLLSKVIEVIRVLILIRIVLSWLMPYNRNEFTMLVYNVTEPMLKPFRVLLPMGNVRIDLSPIILLFVLGFLNRLVYMVF
jgi:YggT family protein